jgi:uncharacterized protein YjbJ (UPF0337 family)
MNSDQITGKIKVIAGEIQEYTGRFLGDINQEAQGYALEFEGITQRQKGDAKEAFEELVKNNFEA